MQGWRESDHTIQTAVEKAVRSKAERNQFRDVSLDSRVLLLDDWIRSVRPDHFDRVLADQGIREPFDEIYLVDTDYPERSFRAWPS